MPRLAVVYDQGAVTPGEIAVGLAPLGGVSFVVAESDHTRALRPLLHELGDVIAVADATRGDFDAVLTFSERMLGVTADLAARIGAPFHDRETVALLTAKPRQRERLAQTGVDAVRHHTVAAAADWPAALAAVGLPAVLKPARGEGSRDTVLVTDEAVGRRVVTDRFARGGSALTCEEYLTGRVEAPYGDYVSVEGAVSDGVVSTIAVTSKFPLLHPFRERGDLWPSHLPADEQDAVAELAARAVLALGVRTGITHTEIKLTAAGPRVIEVNGRLGGFVNELSRRATGCDLVTLAGRLALGEAVDHRPAPLDRVHFQYSNLAPPVRCTLDRIDGVRDLRAIDGVTVYQPQVRPGSPLTDGVMTRAIDLLGGHAADHASVLDTVRAATEAVAFVFTTLDAPRRTWRVTGADLACDGS